MQQMLFKSDLDWQNNACLNFTSDSHYGYVRGYKEAADLLAQQAAEEHKQDFFVYPIAFLYRHYLELILKLIIRTGSDLIESPKKSLNNHALDWLWLIAKEIIKKIWDDVDEPTEFELIENVISEYSAIDKNSQAFRYPDSEKGEKHLAGIKHINLRHLAEIINSAASFLDGIYIGIEAYLYAKQEMLASCPE